MISRVHYTTLPFIISASAPQSIIHTVTVSVINTVDVQSNLEVQRYLGVPASGFSCLARCCRLCVSESEGEVMI